MNFYATDGCLRLPYPAVPTSLSSGICKTLGYVCVFLEWTTNNNIMQAMSSFFFTGRTTITAVLFPWLRLFIVVIIPVVHLIIFSIFRSPFTLEVIF